MMTDTCEVAELGKRLHREKLNCSSVQNNIQDVCTLLLFWNVTKLHIVIEENLLLNSITYEAFSLSLCEALLFLLFFSCA